MLCFFIQLVLQHSVLVCVFASIDSSEMDLKLASSYKPTHGPLTSLVLRVYLLNYMRDLTCDCSLTNVE